jgi:hypothetical protein
VEYRGIARIAAVAGVFLFLAVSTNLWSQQYKTCLFPTIDLSTTEDYREYQAIIFNQLQVELRSAGFELIPREEWEPVRERQGVRTDTLYQGNVAVEIARQVDAEIAVVSFYSVEERQLVLEIKCYDVQQNALVTGAFKMARINLSVYNVIDEAVAELIPGIRLIGPPPVNESPVVEDIALLSEDEGAEIYLGDEGFVGRITDGQLQLPPIPFAIGSKITIEQHKDSYHTGIETIKLKEPEMLVELKPLRKKARTATELNWTLGQLMGFGLAQRYYLKPDSFFLTGEHYFFVQHNLSDSKPVFHHDLRLLVGGYLFTGPHATYRMNLNTGFGMMVTYFWLADQPMYADFYWNVLSIGLELNFRKYLLYVRSEQKYALGWGPAHILEQGWISIFGDVPTIITLGVARKW